MTRKTAAEHDISDHIYFGANGDPVEELTVEQISTLMPTIKRWYGDQILEINVLRLRK